MKTLVMLLVCASMVLAVGGCKKKTTEDKLKDAATSLQKDAEKTAGDAKKAAEDLKK